MGALIPQGLAGSPNHFGFLNNLVTLINYESLKEIGGIAYVTPARSSHGQTRTFCGHMHSERLQVTRGMYHFNK